LLAWRILDRFGLVAFRWTPAEVVDATGPEYNVRCYLERRGIREILADIAPGRLGRGIDVGCGYGRLSMVLTEFCDEVVGLEREPALVARAQALLPDVRFVRVATLADLPLEDDGTDVAMTFAVLQHMTDDEARGAIDEMKRAVRPGGHVLLTEKTDTGRIYGDPGRGARFLSQGRSVETFASWMEPFELVRQEQGRAEPGYPADRLGTSMLFRAPVG
jgi:SAM-dependent methyltransferase